MGIDQLQAEFLQVEEEYTRTLKTMEVLKQRILQTQEGIDMAKEDVDAHKIMRYLQLRNIGKFHQLNEP